MLDSTNENAPLAGEAHQESTDNQIMPTAEKSGNSKSYFTTVPHDDGGCEFVLGEDVGRTFCRYTVMFQQGNDLYIAHDQLHDELVVVHRAGNCDVELRSPFSLRMVGMTITAPLEVLQ